MSNLGMEQHEPPTFEYQDNNDADGPSFWWRNPWSGQREKIASLFWPTHPGDATATVEHLFEHLSLTYKTSK